MDPVVKPREDGGGGGVVTIAFWVQDTALLWTSLATSG
jgi:hypothetical protein